MGNRIESHGIYKYACPNCGGEITDLRLFYGLPCTKCLPNIELKRYDVLELGRILQKHGVLKEYKWFYEIERKLRRVEEFFNKATGSRFWSAQRTWTRRVLRGKSFAIVAPTGVGKTMFGLTMSLFLAKTENAKSYIIVPTTPLVMQAEKKLSDLIDKTKANVKILAIHSRLPRKERTERLSRLQAGDFHILITTARFLQQNFNKLAGIKFRFIFVDDVDAVLKSSKSIDLLLMLMGFDEQDLEIGFELIKLRRELALYLSRNDKDQVEKTSRRISELERKISQKRRKLKSVLIVSTATGRPRGTRVKLFRELLGFEVGSRSEFLRNITDSYIKPSKDIDETVSEIVNKLGTGGLVFVPIDKGIEYAEKLAEYISEHTKFKAGAFHSKAIKNLDQFIQGEIDVLVGVATYYGVMVRGLDLPDRVRYAVFAGVPRLKFSTQLEDPHPVNIFRALTLLREAVEEEEKQKVEVMIARLRRHLQRLSTAALAKLAEILRSEQEPQSRIDRDFYEALNYVREMLKREDVRRRLRENPELSIIEEEGKTYILVPDVMTYIQASGRTSRMYAGGLTYGLSVVIIDDERLFRGLVKRIKWIIEDIEWKDFNELNLNDILKKIDEDREKVKKILSGMIRAEIRDLVRTALMVVESPNKARTIANFFGKPNVRTINDVLKVYEVTTGNLILMITASGGHIYDLVKDPIGFHGILIEEERKKTPRFTPVYTSIKRCLVCGYQFTDETKTCPRCGSTLIKDSKEVVRALRELSSEVDMVLIGTDPDTEGEKIGWDTAVLLSPYTRNIRRIEFHEVTRKAITKALESIREFDMKLVEAQIVRRVEDRWIGFTLSPLLWYEFWPAYCKIYVSESKKKKRKYECKPGENRNLSAGRVQSPVLGWIIERFIEHKKSQKYFYRFITPRVDIEFSEDELKGALPSLEREELLKQVIEVKKVSERIEEIKPLPPFTTDTLLAEASTKFKLSTTEIMNIAQDLFELGFITYHRTDSTRVSDAGINVAREYLKEKYGDKYKELFVPRTWGTGGAHEAIRPTRPIDAERLRELIAEGIIQPVRILTRYHYLIYDLIFRRFIASQMKPAKVKREVYNVKIGNAIKQLDHPTELIEPGFMDIYRPFEIVPSIPEGKHPIQDVIIFKRAEKTLYTQGDVVALMKKRKIGRPSTYAKIIQTLMQRGYVAETAKQRKLVATELGMGVYSFLSALIIDDVIRQFTGDNKEIILELHSKFKDLTKYVSKDTLYLLAERVRKLVSEERTRILEQYMDYIEEGKKYYQDVLLELYNEVKDIALQVQRFNNTGNGININRK